MRQTRADIGTRRARGVTLIEMIISMIVVSIVVAITIFFVNPIRQATDLAARAELTDIADNTLQRIGRDVRLALPNSVRTNGTVIEFIPVRTAGRYRATPSGACVSANDDDLSFGTSDSCFKSIGAIPNDTTVTTSDYLVLNNYGTGFTNQDAHAGGAGGNRAQISAPIASQQKVTYTSTTFTRTLHDSAGRRFYIVTTPVAYVCNVGARTITRYSGYGFTASLDPATIASGSAALIAADVAGCSFDYSANVAPMVGLLTLGLALNKATSSGTETVTLYHSVHVNNVP